MKILVYGDHTGSGGYYSHFKGVFSSGVWQENPEIDTVITGSDEFINSLNSLDENLKLLPSKHLAHKNQFVRYLWHLWFYPNIAFRFKPDIEFYPSGNLRDFLRNPRSVTMCRNLLPFDDSEHEFYRGEPEYKYWNKFARKQGRIFERSNGVIFLSEHSKNIVIKQYPLIKNPIVIPHGIDEAFRQVNLRSYKIGKAINLLYVSPIYNYKHQKEVLLAVSKLRNEFGLPIILSLVGGHNESKDYRLFMEVFKTLNAHKFTKLLPFLSREQTLCELKKADLFVFASSCECFPNSLVEAMAARLPIACSNRAGLPEILKDSGVYFNPEIPDEIAVSIKQLIDNEELRERLGKIAYLYSLEYSWRRCANETLDYFKTFI